MTGAPQKHSWHAQRAARLVNLQGRRPDDLAQFFLEERSRRSFGITGYLVSGAGAGAISCWFAINSLYASKAPPIVLRLLLTASGILMLAVVIGFFAALAGYKAFETAASLPADAFDRPYNRADQWLRITIAARVVTAVLISIGGLTVFAAYLGLIWP
jgi:hypothetical protein